MEQLIIARFYKLQWNNWKTLGCQNNQKGLMTDDEFGKFDEIPSKLLNKLNMKSPGVD